MTDAVEAEKAPEMFNEAIVNELGMVIAQLRADHPELIAIGCAFVFDPSLGNVNPAGVLYGPEDMDPGLVAHAMKSTAGLAKQVSDLYMQKVADGLVALRALEGQIHDQTAALVRLQEIEKEHRSEGQSPDEGQDAGDPNTPGANRPSKD
jgi:hypothetical protein